ncbi:hypothetical protein Daus18300_002062 [Diaporthe australafricana]|uniref:Heterokaryon incompatibility domain-containing protein n=1 Tax=Diaporthe australafricana TaxID=127596 RepID=A0ABR3XQ85_9PEZI
MHSYERQAGNTYGVQDPVAKPPYATLSYTWARYLRHEDLSARGIRISGIDWDTPNIDPNHFTTQKLHQAIRKIREISQLDYLWIDLACINVERIPEDDTDLEIDMQQDIFFNAAASFIWLSRTEHSYISQLANMLVDVPILDDAKTVSTLLRVMADPWFSSLWTLLEAAVGTKAIIISSDCQATTVHRAKIDPAFVDEPKAIRVASENDESVFFEKISGSTVVGRGTAMSPVTSQFFTLRDLICLVERTISLIPFGDQRDEVQEAVNRSGLLSLKPFNLLSIYGSAQHRHEMKPGLRLKYIHNQLFGFHNLPAGDTTGKMFGLAADYRVQDS